MPSPPPLLPCTVCAQQASAVARSLGAGVLSGTGHALLSLLASCGGSVGPDVSVPTLLPAAPHLVRLLQLLTPRGPLLGGGGAGEEEEDATSPYACWPFAAVALALFHPAFASSTRADLAAVLRAAMQATGMAPPTAIVAEFADPSGGDAVGRLEPDDAPTETTSGAHGAGLVTSAATARAAEADGEDLPDALAAAVVATCDGNAAAPVAWCLRYGCLPAAALLADVLWHVGVSAPGQLEHVHAGISPPLLQLPPCPRAPMQALRPAQLWPPHAAPLRAHLLLRWSRRLSAAAGTATLSAIVLASAACRHSVAVQWGLPVEAADLESGVWDDADAATAVATADSVRAAKVAVLSGSAASADTVLRAIALRRIPADERQLEAVLDSVRRWGPPATRESIIAAVRESAGLTVLRAASPRLGAALSWLVQAGTSPAVLAARRALDGRLHVLAGAVRAAVARCVVSPITQWPLVHAALLTPDAAAVFSACRAAGWDATPMCAAVEAGTVEAHRAAAVACSTSWKEEDWSPVCTVHVQRALQGSPLLHSSLLAAAAWSALLAAGDVLHVAARAAAAPGPLAALRHDPAAAWTGASARAAPLLSLALALALASDRSSGGGAATVEDVLPVVDVMRRALESGSAAIDSLPARGGSDGATHPMPRATALGATKLAVAEAAPSHGQSDLAAYNAIAEVAVHVSQDWRSAWESAWESAWSIASPHPLHSGGTIAAAAEGTGGGVLESKLGGGR